MTKSARQIVFEAMELLPDVLAPYVEGRLAASLTGHWRPKVAENVAGLRVRENGEIAWDQQALLKTMERFWNEAFRQTIGRIERNCVGELIEIRNQLSHNHEISQEDAEHALNSMRRLMQAIGAPDVARRIAEMRDAVLRARFAGQGEPPSPQTDTAREAESSERTRAKPPRRRSMGTTVPGYQNKNGQVVIRKTDLPGNDHLQRIYVLRCSNCGHEYGANGSDISLRRGAKCDDGRPGLPY